MKLSKNARILLDRYLLGVRRALPAKKSSDIAAEFESTLLDRLDERYPAMAEVNEEQLKEMLQEMGSPNKVAASYGPQRSLIGTRFFPAYLLVLRIVVPVVLGALTLALAVGFIAGSITPDWKAILEYIASLFNGAFMAAAWVTLIFAIIERASEDKRIDELEEFEKFNPKDLPELTDTEKKPDVFGTLFEIVMSMVGLAFFTYLLSTDGSFPVYINPAEKLGQVRIFTDSFLRFVPAMMAVAGIEIARNVIFLSQGRKGRLTNSLQYLIHVAHIVISVLLLGSFPLISVDWLQGFAETASWDFPQIVKGIHTFIRWGLYLSILGSVVEMIKQAGKQLRATI